MEVNQSVIVRPIRTEGYSQLINLSCSHSDNVLSFSGDTKLKDLAKALQEYYPACKADGLVNLILSFEVGED